jgi:hypothetical protein
MNNKLKLGMCILFMLFFMGIATASDGCFVNENCTWWATISSGTELYDADSANVTIYDFNHVIVVDNQLMTKINKTFIYVANHNNSGNYLGVARFYDGDTLLDTATQSLEVKDDRVKDNATMTAIIMGIIAIAGLMFYASSQVNSDKTISLSRALEKVLLYFGGLGFIAVAWYFMITVTKNTPTYYYLYAPLNTFFILLALMIFAILMNYIYHVVIELTINRINQKKTQYDKEDDKDY